DLAAFADPQPPVARAIDVAAELRGIVEGEISAHRLRGEQCKLDISDGSRGAWADAGHFRVIVQELLANAIEANDPAAGLVTIKTRPHRTDEQIVMTIADNGRGMTPEVRDRAFDPFFSHRPAGRGRGLGLARVVRLTELNGGRVRLQSEPGRG